MDSELAYHVEPVLSWDEIRCFLYAAETGSFARAGEILGMDASTVSRQVKHLESALGAILFNRRGKRVFLTSEGEASVGKARAMAESAAAFTRELHGATDIPAGEVRINVTEGLSSIWLLPRLRPFQEANPNVAFKWFVTNTNPSEIGTEVDVALTPLRPDSPQVVRQRIAQVRYRLMAMPAYVDRYGRPKNIDDLANHRILHFAGYDVNPQLKRWKQMMRRFPPVMMLENTSALLGIMQAGDCLTLLPDYVECTGWAELVRLLPEFMIKVDLWIAYHETRRGNARIRAVIDEIKRLADESRGPWFD